MLTARSQRWQLSRTLIFRARLAKIAMRPSVGADRWLIVCARCNAKVRSRKTRTACEFVPRATFSTPLEEKQDLNEQLAVLERPIVNAVLMHAPFFHKLSSCMRGQMWSSEGPAGYCGKETVFSTKR